VVCWLDLYILCIDISEYFEEEAID